MPTKTVEVDEAQRDFARLLSLGSSATEIVLTEDSKPVARLVPVPVTAGPRVPGLHAGTMRTAEDFDAPLPDDFWLSGR